MRAFQGRQQGHWMLSIRQAKGKSAPIQGQIGHPRDRRHHEVLVCLLGVLGIYRRWACSCLLGRCGDGGHGIRAISPHWNDLASQRPGHPRNRGREGRGWHASELRGEAVHVQLRPGDVQRGVRRHRGRSFGLGSRSHFGPTSDEQKAP